MDSTNFQPDLTRRNAVRHDLREIGLRSDSSSVFDSDFKSHTPTLVPVIEDTLRHLGGFSDRSIRNEVGQNLLVALHETARSVTAVKERLDAGGRCID